MLTIKRLTLAASAALVALTLAACSQEEKPAEPAQAPAETHLAARHILNDLRAGYLLGFTPSDTPGWHRLTVKVSRKDARVRTRAGFWVGTRPF